MMEPKIRVILPTQMWDLGGIESWAEYVLERPLKQEEKEVLRQIYPKVHELVEKGLIEQADELVLAALGIEVERVTLRLPVVEDKDPSP